MNTLRTLTLALFMSVFCFGWANAQQGMGINDVLTGKVCDSAVISDWNGTSWEQQYVQIFKLDASGYASEVRLRDSTGILYNLIFTRNASHMATKQEAYTNFGGSFLHFADAFYYYNANNKMIQEIGTQYNFLTSGMDSSYRDNYTYDASNYLIRLLSESYDNGAWVNTTRTTYTNNTNGMPVTTYVESWDVDSAKYFASSRTTSTYDSKDRVETEVEEGALPTVDSFEWVNQSRTTYTYNSADQIIVTLGEIWDDMNSAWMKNTVDSVIGSKTISYAYNGTGWEPTSMTDCVSGAISTIPSAPTNLTATAKSNGNIDLSWNGSADADGYNVYRSLDSANWSMIATVHTTKYSDTSAVANTTYYYEVTAYNTAGESDTSNAVSAMAIAAVKPNAPTALTASANASGDIELNWTASADADGYYVYRDDSTTSWTKIATVSGTSYTDTAVTPNMEYTYYVSAYNAGGESDSSNNVMAMFVKLNIPDAPTSLTAIPNNLTESISLTWNASANATGYKLYRSTDSTNWTMINSDTTTLVTDTTVSVNVLYYYYATAFNADGESGASNVVSAMITKPVKPAAPKNLTASANSNGDIDLSWSGSTGADGYNVYRTQDVTSTWDNIATVTSASYTDTTVNTDTVYYYRVTAINTAGESDSSNVASAIVVSVSKPDAPTALVATANSATGYIELLWNSSTNADGYNVYRSQDSTNWSKLATVPAALFTDTAVSVSTVYYYKVSAYNTAGESGFSNTDSAMLIESGIASLTRSTLAVYPNPANDHIVLNTEGLNGNYTMVISNILGDRILVQTVSNANGRLNLNISSLKPGVYNVSLQNQNSIHTARIIIAR